MKKTDDGSILFPKRGKPPVNPDPDTYVRDTHDPFIFHLKLPDCNHRVERLTVLPCGKCQTNKYCNYNNERVDYLTCNLCDKEKLC